MLLLSMSLSETLSKILVSQPDLDICKDIELDTAKKCLSEYYPNLLFFEGIIELTFGLTVQAFNDKSMSAISELIYRSFFVLPNTEDLWIQSFQVM